MSAARYALGLLSAEAAMRQADEFLGDSVFTPAASELVYLRFEPNLDGDEAVALFGRMLDQLGIAVPSREDSIWTLARYHIDRIASGEVDPKEGLSALRSEVYLGADLYGMDERFVGDSFDLQELLGIYYGYDSVPGLIELGLSHEGESTREGIEQAMGIQAVNLANDWLEAHGLTSAST